MNTSNELTIVIPAKNEANLISNLLTSLIVQDYQHMPNTKVYLADADSSDGTPDIARSYSEWLDIEVIRGGLPGVGRNNGARLAKTSYVLFIDADIEISDTTLIRRSVELMKRKQLHCLTTNIACPQGGAWDRWLYAGNNLMQHLSSLYRPFSTGMYMMFDLAEFKRLGGFHEQALYAEDYLLSQKVARSRFDIVPGHIVTTNRRIKKIGHFNLVRLFLNTALHTHRESFFLRDHKYWHSEA
jgi:glycosyltransferase involved in cell wall biosynthesis